MHKINYTVILPIHKIDELYTELLINSVGSIQDFHNDVLLTIVCPKILNLKLRK